MNFIDFMGEMGGTPDLLYIFVSVFFGSYIKFHATLMNIKSLY